MSNLIGRRGVMEGAMLGVAASAMAGVASAATKADPSVATLAKQQSLSPEDQKVADQLIALAKGLEEAEIAKNPEEWAKFVSEDYTEINEHFSSMLKGRELVKKYQEFNKATPHIIAASVITNPDVQVWGDVAILCYVSLRAIRDKNGRSDPGCRRVTRIYKNVSGKWTLVHCHFSAYDYMSTY